MNALSLEEQRVLFAGCYVDIFKKRIYVPGFGLLDRKRFNVVFGGRTFVIAGRDKTRSAWIAAMTVIPRK